MAAPRKQAERGPGMYLCYATDEQFAMQTGVSMLSVLLTTPARPLCFYILDGGLSPRSRTLLSGIAGRHNAHVEYIDILPRLDLVRQFGQKAWGDFPSLVTWARMFLPQLLPGGVDRILYLDGDTLAVQDISGLYNTDLTGVSLAAVEDCVNRQYRTRLGLSADTPYINAGVLLFNIAELRRTIPENWPEVYFRHGVVYAMADQDVLNLMVAGSCRRLPLRFNYNSWYRALSPAGLRLLMEDPTLCSFSDAEVAACAGGAVILHFNTCKLLVRPWYQGQTDPAGALWRQVHARSPWADIPFSAEPDNLSRGELRDRQMYQRFGPKAFPYVHEVDYRLRRTASRLLHGG